MSTRMSPAATGSFWRQKLRSTSPHQERALRTPGSVGARVGTSCGARICSAMATSVQVVACKAERAVCRLQPAAGADVRLRLRDLGLLDERPAVDRVHVVALDVGLPQPKLERAIETDEGR